MRSAVDTHGMWLKPSRVDKVEVWKAQVMKTFPSGLERDLSDGAMAHFTINFKTNDRDVMIELSADDARDVIALAEQMADRGGKYHGAQYVIEARTAIAGN